jgi:hypothetical protein
MTVNQDQTEAEAQAQAHSRSWSSIFGEDDGPPMFGPDESAPPHPTSSAAIHAKRRRANELEARQARDLAQLQVVAQDEADGLDLAHALRLARAGKQKQIPPDVMAGAMRAARAKGMTNMTSAQLLAMGHGSRA